MHSKRLLAVSLVFVGLLSLLVVTVSGDDESKSIAGIVSFSSQMKERLSDNLSLADHTISVGLYTQDGILKATAVVDPTGYYFFLWEGSGDFILKPILPEGWFVEPSSLEVSSLADSALDDIMFEITGFSITLTVAHADSCGHAGYDGVSIRLQDTADPDSQHNVTVNSQGLVHFPNMLPSAYSVSAYHFSWVLVVEAPQITLRATPVAFAGAVRVVGYPLIAKIHADNQPIANVPFYVRSADDAATAALAQLSWSCSHTLPSQPQSAGVLCSTLSSSTGLIYFAGMPCSRYIIYPAPAPVPTPTQEYSSSQPQWTITPSEGVWVNEEQLGLEGEEKASKVLAYFEVEAFTVSGQVVNDNGVGIGGVAVRLSRSDPVLSDRAWTTQTTASGDYQLFPLTAGHYAVQAEKSHFRFAAFPSLRVSAAAPRLAPLLVEAVEVCGHFEVDKTQTQQQTTDFQAHSRSVSYRLVTSLVTTQVFRARADVSGKFCHFLMAGTYELLPILSEEEVKSGKSFAPAQVRVVVGQEPLLSAASFTYQSLTLTGKIKCLQSCEVSSRMQVQLKVGETEEVLAGVIERVEGESDHLLQFSLSGLPAGSHTVEIQHEGWCWKSSSMVVDAGNLPRELVFEQSGYILDTHLSHEMSLDFHLKGRDESDHMQKGLKKGINRFCLTKPGLYEIRSSTACYKLADSENLVYDTSFPKPLKLEVSQFRVKGSIELSGGEEDETISQLEVIVSRNGQISKVVARAMPEQTGLFDYELWASVNEKFDISVSSVGQSVFLPRRLSFNLQDAVCPPSLKRFSSAPGIFVHGQVSPPKEGAVVTLKSSQSNLVITTETGADGKYVAGPLYDEDSWSASAQLEGYSFRGVEKFNFEVTELIKLQIQVVDKVSGTGLAGVTVSVSSAGYRSNAKSLANGIVLFPDLQAGEYYIRPILKEYDFGESLIKFTLSSEENQLKIEGTRTAFSVMGTVKSLSAVPVNGVKVRAQSVELKGTQQFEDAVTKNDGSYRLRGLKPGQDYTIAVELLGVGEIAAPLEMSWTGKAVDSVGLDFLMFRPSLLTEISGIVEAPTEHLQTLTLHLSNATSGERLRTFAMSLSPFFAFPRLSPGAYELTVTSSLAQHQYRMSTTPLLVNTSVASHGLRLPVLIETRAMTESLNASGVYVIVLTMLLGAAIYYWQTAPGKSTANVTALAHDLLGEPGTRPARKHKKAGKRSA